MTESAAANHRGSTFEELGDFTTTVRVIPISAMAILIGILGAFVAWFLLRLIGLFTNIFYYHRISTAFVSPAGNHLGAYAVSGSDRWFADCGLDGAIRLGTDSRPRNP